jgi:branched-chain amino acid transport system permease protein
VLAQNTVHGILLGSFYATIALGLSLVFGVMRLVNLAHGVLILGGGYLAYALCSVIPMDPLLSLLFVCPAMFLFGYALQRFLLTSLLMRGAEAALVASFGIMLFGQSVFTVLFTSSPTSLNASYGLLGYELFGIRVRVIELIACAFGIGLVAIVAALIGHTRFGTALQAAAADPATASTMGINVHHLYAVTFGLAAAIAAVAGVIIGIAFSITPTAGLAYLTIGFAIVVLGGMGSMWGTLVAAVIVGLAQTFGGAFFGPIYQMFTVYALFILLLTLRPQGLFGRAAA